VKQHILIVEDNPLNSELLRDWLEIEGYAVMIAPNLSAAFAALSSQRPDVVLLDVQLGEEDGLSLAIWIRQEATLREIPVLAVTAQVMTLDRQRILGSGCNSIVSKPIDFKVLQEQLDLWLGATRETESNRVAGND
jgi:two-component system cell cycle response regulator DivK